MPENVQIDPLQSVVSSYLATLIAVADCLAAANPDIGEPYRQRIRGMRSRLAFNGSAEAVEAGARDLEIELQDYAKSASSQADRKSLELRRGMQGLQEIVRLLAQRQDFYNSRLRQFAAQMEAATYPSDPAHLTEVVALQAAGLRSCVESVSHEVESLVLRMRGELNEMEQRVEQTRAVDPVTGLMNRRELERLIESRRTSGGIITLLKFDVTEESGGLSDTIAKQAAERLLKHFRHRDMIARWSPNEFVVLFQGPPELAQTRAARVVPWIAGVYTNDAGTSVAVNAAAQFMLPEALPA